MQKSTARDEKPEGNRKEDLELDKSGGKKGNDSVTTRKWHHISLKVDQDLTRGSGSSREKSGRY